MAAVVDAGGDDLGVRYARSAAHIVNTAATAAVVRNNMTGGTKELSTDRR